MRPSDEGTCLFVFSFLFLSFFDVGCGEHVHPFVWYSFLNFPLLQLSITFRTIMLSYTSA